MKKCKDEASGLQLLHLMQSHLTEILAREEENAGRIHLYRTGEFWVAFEQSAYLLHALDDNVKVIPMKVAPVTRPLAMASLDNGLTERLTHTAGNFYINDKPTGAVVDQQPFGGGRASGTNDKAGSVFNLLRWVSPQCIKETFIPATSYMYPNFLEE